MLIQQYGGLPLYTPQWDTAFVASGLMKGVGNATTIGLAINAGATNPGITPNQTRLKKAIFSVGPAVAGATALPVDAFTIVCARGGTALPAGGGSTKPVVTKMNPNTVGATSTVIDNGGGTPAAITGVVTTGGSLQSHVITPPNATGQTTHTLTASEVIFDFARNFEQPPCTSSAVATDSLIFSVVSPADETSTSWLIAYTLIFEETTQG